MKRSLTTLILASLLISTLPLSVSADATEDIPTNAAATGVHDSLVAALTHANLVTTLQGDGPFTVFAPTDQAFIDAGIDLSTFDTDAENATLADILTYHVVAGKVMSTDLADSTAADALNGDKLSFTVSTSEVKVNGAVVTGADVETSNGVIHVIDKVLMPPVDVFVSDGSMTSPYYQFYTDSAGYYPLNEIDITQSYKFQRLNNPSTHPFYIGDSGYEADSSAEVFIVGDGTSTTGISNDESFTAFFKDGFTVEDTLSYFCTVHSGMFADFTLTQPVTLVDIPTIATGTGVHDSLVAALSKADLVTTLQGDGPFTVFAPTDQAFTDAGIDLSTFVTDEEIAALADILTYHVVSGSVLSTALTDGLTATAVNGDDVTFTVNEAGVMVNDANVVTADVVASNGVVHVIDKVLMPPADLVDIPTIATGTGVHDSLVAALSQANLVATLQGDGPFTVFAPTDEAFTAAGIDLASFDTDAENDTLVDILTYHVVSGSVLSSALTDGMVATALNGDDVTFTVNDAGVMVNDANVVTADVVASNGVVHVIDKVLMPPADLVDIPTIATGTGVHDSLVAALSKADLVTTLQGDGPFTVFAPTDEAFAAAGIDLSTFETDEEIATLADILTYHVVSGSVLSTALTDGMTATALNGDDVTFTVNDAGVMVNDANVVTADVVASNGVVHVIDKVLMPPADPVDEPEEPVLATCDAVVRIAPSGMKYSPAEVTISVGQTVCWQWENESMAHNVREVDGDQSTTYTANGVTSGVAMTTVDFRYTFDVDSTTFYYACEPHLAAGMFGKVIVGDGGVVATPPAVDNSMDADEETVPGFLVAMTTIALAGAVIVSSRRSE
tara:strand:- start:70 stop:2604 length:2535 start_codon:yes stop_codon:yes gene_type:complete